MGNPEGVEKRPGRIEHYFNRAEVAAERSTCLRRKVGAVIIKDDVEISSGYVGSPRRTVHCVDIGKCLRKELEIPSGERYELCRSVHAEQNAIINAARTGANVKDGEMYISSEKIGGGHVESKNQNRKIYGPCMICKKQIINAGLKVVHTREEGIGIISQTLEDIRDSLAKDEEDLRSRFDHSMT